MDQSMYNLNEVYSSNSAEKLVEKSLHRRVFLTVSIAHIVFVIGPFVLLGLWTKLYDKKPAPIHVDISNINAGGMKTEEPPGIPNTPKNENKKAEKKETAEDETTVEEPPPKPVKKETVEKPVVKPVEKETVKVPTDKKVPEIKTAEKKVEPSKTADPKKSKEIKISDKVVKVNNPVPAKPKISGTDLAAKLKKIQITNTANEGTSGAGLPGPPGGFGSTTGTGTVPAGYYESVSAYLYDLWKQPGKAELKGLKPTVTVHVSIDASGNIKSAKIVKKSNNLPMDSSIEELLSNLKKLPPPPQGALELDITLEIDEN